MSMLHGTAVTKTSNVRFLDIMVTAQFSRTAWMRPLTETSF